METEYEAKFLDVDKAEVRARLKAKGAILKRPEFLQRRWVLDMPIGLEAKNTWLRVRDEGDKITMTWKSQQGGKIDDQKELELQVDNFDNAVEFLEKLGCPPESYQETKRELWNFNNAKITIDTWPFVEPFVEVEGDSEEVVREAAISLGFDWQKAWFDSVSAVYRLKHGAHIHIRKMPQLTFSMDNPFT
jgi:adenylate cyclase, class 2